MDGNGYSYRASVKSDASDELINTYLLRPAAGLLVRALYRTRVTPNQVTVAASVAGFVAAALYLQGTAVLTVIAGLCVTLKDLLDSADGQLARARGMFSRRGRFLDSLGDIAVNATVFTAIAVAGATVATGGRESVTFGFSGASVWIAACAVAFLGITLRVSYHVFYQTSFLHLSNAYTGNRLSEEILAEDVEEDRLTAALHRTFLVLYGWQDRLMARLDAFCGGSDTRLSEERWYGDVTGVRLSGFLGLGTELFLLTAFSVAGRLDMYLAVNIAGMNLVWLACVLYRWVLLRRSIIRGGVSSPGRHS